MSGVVTGSDEINLAGGSWSPLIYYPAGTLVLRLFELPSWDTATRPAVGLNPGRSGFNTDLGTQETWNGAYWVPMIAGLSSGPAVLCWASSANAIVSNGTVDVLPSWPWQAGSISSVVARTRVGSFTAAILVNGTAVPNLAAVSVNSPTASTTRAYANGLVAGASLSVGITAASGSPTDSVLQINYQRSAT